MSLTPEISAEIQKLEPSAVIELFQLDLTNQGGDVYYFHAGTNQLSANIVFDGQEYVRYPVDITGFEFSGSGQWPRPRLKVSNILSAITTILIAYNDLLGAKVTRIRTLVKFLDAVNFTGGVNSDADPLSKFENDIYYVDRKSSEDRDFVEFELASASDLVGIKLPRRQIIQNICQWEYKSAECGYTGGPLWDINDERLELTGSAEAIAVLSSWQTVLDKKAILDAKNVLLTAAANQKDYDCSHKVEETRFEITGVTTDYFYKTVVYGVRVASSYQPYPASIYNGTQAYYNSTLVTIGADYSIGPDQGTYYSNATTGGTTIKFYSIIKRSVNASACSTSTSALTAATTARNAAKTDYDNAVTEYGIALAALPPNDPLYALDRCGKRLTSCKNRFGATAELPFGGFPSVGLIK